MNIFHTALAAVAAATLLAWVMEYFCKNLLNQQEEEVKNLQKAYPSSSAIYRLPRMETGGAVYLINTDGNVTFVRFKKGKIVEVDIPPLT